MAVRTVVLVLLVGTLSTATWAQGGTCEQVVLWGMGGNAGCNGYPSAEWMADLETLEAQYGGAGPNCTYTPNPFNPICEQGGCNSFGWRCTTGQTPPTPAVGGCPDGTCAGDPIALATGNTFIKELDTRISGLGGGLTLERTWNSTWISGIHVGMFGTQWSSTYEEQVSLGTDGTMKLGRSNGSTWSFAALSQNGGFSQPAALQTVAPGNVQTASLLMNNASSAVWTVTFQNGEQRVFNGVTGGALSAIIDRNGNTTSLTYDGNGRLTTVTDPANRHLNFAYGSNISNDVVTNVTSDSGTNINITYAYETGAQLGLNPLWSNYPFLTQVTQSDASFVTFTYSYDGLITSVNDSVGKVLEAHTYGVSGCNAGLSSTRANGVDSLTISFPDVQFCSYAGVGGP